jgi:hypothetical protein
MPRSAARLGTGNSIGVIAHAIANVEGARGRAGDCDRDAVEFPSRFLVLGIIAEQIFGAQIVAYLPEGGVQPARIHVIVLAAGLRAERDQRVLAAGVATRRAAASAWS